MELQQLIEIVGSGDFRHHTRHDNLSVLWLCGRVRTLFVVSLCCQSTSSPSVILCSSRADLPACRCFLRCCHCNQVFRCLNQVSDTIHLFPSCTIELNGFTSSYLIIIKSLMPSVVAALYHDLTSPDTNPPDWALSSHVWITIIMVILFPLSFLRKLDNLRHTSYVALFSVGTSKYTTSFLGG